MNHVTSLAECNKVAQAIVGGIMIPMGCRKRNSGAFDVVKQPRLAGGGSLITAQGPALTTAPCSYGVIPPTTIT
jgi:hypothetical protein